MKYFKQFGWIMIVTCIGEIMKYYIPLPIPASIYGLVLMMTLLMTGVVKIEKVYQVICTPFTGQTSKGGIYYALLI